LPRTILVRSDFFAAECAERDHHVTVPFGGIGNDDNCIPFRMKSTQKPGASAFRRSRYITDHGIGPHALQTSAMASCLRQL
jgi:hypothetical protein